MFMVISASILLVCNSFQVERYSGYAIRLRLELCIFQRVQSILFNQNRKCFNGIVQVWQTALSGFFMPFFRIVVAIENDALICCENSFTTFAQICSGHLFSSLFFDLC